MMIVVVDDDIVVIVDVVVVVVVVVVQLGSRFGAHQCLYKSRTHIKHTLSSTSECL